MSNKFETKSQAIIRLVRFSVHGAMAQFFIIDALDKQKVTVPAYGPKDTNESVIKKVLKADAGAAEAVLRQAIMVHETPVETLIEQFGPRHIINPRSWHAVAGEIAQTLKGAA